MNKIIRRKYYCITVKLASPLNVSDGKSVFTDADVMLNGDNEAFVPGTSLAGAFRNYFEQKKNIDGYMGFSDGEDGRMSPVIISDLLFVSSPRKSVRDGIKLKMDRTVEEESKYDMEILETGAVGSFRIEIIQREKDTLDYNKFIRAIIRGISSGDIRFGKKKNRGFGRFEIIEIEEKEFDSESREDWIAFCEKPSFEKKMTVDEWLDCKVENEKYIKIVVPLTLTGGISIRTYSTKPGEPDYAHISCAGKPVIPGSSWNGAIRSDVMRILNDCNCKNAKAIVDNWFGADAKEKDYEQSMVVFSESVLEGSMSMNITRNKINRFSSATIESALYTENATIGGHTDLEIMINKKYFGKDIEALLGALYIAINDLVKGYLPIGGQVSIGRGIFSSNGDVKYSGIELNEKMWLEKLYSLIA